MNQYVVKRIISSIFWGILNLTLEAGKVTSFIRCTWNCDVLTIFAMVLWFWGREIFQMPHSALDSESQYFHVWRNDRRRTLEKWLFCCTFQLSALRLNCLKISFSPYFYNLNSANPAIMQLLHDISGPGIADCGHRKNTWSHHEFTLYRTPDI